MANVKRQQLNNRQKSAFRTKLQILERVVQNRAHILEINQYVPKVLFLIHWNVKCNAIVNTDQNLVLGSYIHTFNISPSQY